MMRSDLEARVSKIHICIYIYIQMCCDFFLERLRWGPAGRGGDLFWLWGFGEGVRCFLILEPKRGYGMYVSYRGCGGWVRRGVR